MLPCAQISRSVRQYITYLNAFKNVSGACLLRCRFWRRLRPRAALGIFLSGEALIYTVTAAVLGTAAILAGAVVLALALGLDAPVLSLASVAVVGGCGFVLLLAATLVPTFLCLRAEVPSQLAAE